MTSKISRIFHGTLIHSLSLTELEIIKDALVGVDEFGKIAFVEKEVLSEQTVNDILSEWEATETKHAPQYPNAGTGLDVPLLEWLEKYTFPLEQLFSSLAFAEKTYPIVVSNLLRHGTTTAVYYATIHLESSKCLARIVHQKGQRGFIGKVNMDRNSPETYIETTESSSKDTENFVKYVLDLDQQSRLVTPIITPRFAISCSSELMHSISEIAERYNVPIQSHLSENDAEIAFVAELFSDPNYTSVYDNHKLLNNRTIMAHGIHLSPEERNLIKTRGAGISHCPNSNFSLCSGVCNVRQLLDEGIKVGLGTDVSGGFSKTILDSIRSASVAGKVTQMTAPKDKKSSPITLNELFYLSTMGGASLLNLENVIGNFEVGKEFDALLIDPESHQSPINLFEGIDDDVERVFEKFLFLGDERNILKVYVRGKMVSGTEYEGDC
ncbi:11014_t:CDS:2 [Acaulospora colombiana]|uniref:11014_t:CDS:1 n=1 Tax=Acaulospora colombiana TaxID=27376 RepID=A0ACA9M7K0_9GLOM|nr:11014_t:CDS:2 [Acaulospora colombiana]